jgi:hypothetical protein
MSLTGWDRVSKATIICLEGFLSAMA